MSKLTHVPVPEECCECGEYTERAGIADDSLHCPDCDSGPYCFSCWDDHGNECEEAHD